MMPPAADAAAWLEARAAGVPPSLHARMLDAVNAVNAGRAARAPGAAGEPLPHRLAAAALHCLREAAACGDDRAAALHLLAADALMTGACEAAAGEPALLDELTAAWRVERLDASAVTGRATWEEL